MWGSSDWFVTKEECTDWIVQTVNEAHPGHGTSITVPNSDHFSNHAKTAQESYRMLYGEQPRPKSNFNPAILGELLSWCDATVGRKRK